LFGLQYASQRLGGYHIRRGGAGTRPAPAAAVRWQYCGRGVPRVVGDAAGWGGAVLPGVGMGFRFRIPVMRWRFGFLVRNGCVRVAEVDAVRGLQPVTGVPSFPR
jgi:hypothetical protein